MGVAAVGSEILVNTATANSQGNPRITTLSDGGFVVTWEDLSEDTGGFEGGGRGMDVRAQVFGADGTPLGDEILVNTATSEAQRSPEVTALSDGGFVIVWEDSSAGVGGAEGDYDSTAVKAQVFGGRGTPIGVEILVNSASEYRQQVPEVTALSTGGFVVVWDDLGDGVGGDTGDGDVSSIKAQLFNADGDPDGLEFLVNTATANSQGNARITTLSDGGFVVTWRDYSQGVGGAEGDESFAAVKAQVFGADGSRVGTEILVNTATRSDQIDSQVASLSNGGFVVTWRDYSEGVEGATGDTEGYAVKAQVFGADGTPVGGEILVNTATQGNQEAPQIAALTGGGFAITWEDNSGGLGGATGDASSGAIKAQVFAADGTQTGTEILVNTATANDQDAPTISALSRGGFVIAWRDLSEGVGGVEGDDNGYATKAQVFDAAGTRVDGEILVNTAVHGDQASAKISALPNGGFVVTWEDGSRGAGGAEGDTSETAVKAQAYGVTVGDPPTLESVAAPTAGTYGAGEDLDFTVTFSEAVTVGGAGTPYISLTLDTGGTVRADYVSGSDSETLTFRYTLASGNQDADGVAVAGGVVLNGGTIRDADGNDADVSAVDFGDTSGVLVDALPLGVASIVRGGAAFTSGDSADFTVTFSKAVTGVDASDFSVTVGGTAAGSVASVTEIDPTTYRVTVEGLSGDGTLRLDLNDSGTDIEDAAHDPISGGFDTGEAYTLDHTAPDAPVLALSVGSNTGDTADLVTSATTPTLAITAEAGSTVAVFDGADLIGTVAAGASFTPAAAFTDGLHTLTATVTDAAGNVSAASGGLALTVDTQAPTLAVSSSAASLNSGATATLTFTFSEAPVGFAAADVSVTGGTLSNLHVTADPKVYAATFKAGGEGSAAINVAGAGFTDLAGNAGASAAPLALNIAPRPPAPTPTPTTTTVDGATVTTTQTTGPTGLPTTTKTIETPAGQVDAAGNPKSTTVALSPATGPNAAGGVTLQISSGSSVKANTSTAPVLNEQLVGSWFSPLGLDSHTTRSLSGALLKPTAAVGVTDLVSLTITKISREGDEPIYLRSDGALIGNTTVVTIDASEQEDGAPPAQVNIDGIDFVVVKGAATIRGGEGKQVAFGDTASQDMKLGADDDELHGGGGADTVASAGGDDLLFGDDGDDSVAGGIGNDTVQGNAGADTVSGEEGDDRAYGGKGDDSVFGDTGDDLIFGDLGDDTLQGNQGTDIVHGGSGDDLIHGGKDADQVWGDDGSDLMFGDLGDDVMQGGQGADTVAGGDGDDVVRGGQGDDVISGGEGNDWLSGDKGSDTVTGGDGADTFHFFVGAGIDRVNDFHQAEGDRVHLDPGTAYTVAQAGADTVITLVDGARMILAGVQMSTLTDGWIFGA